MKKHFYLVTGQVLFVSRSGTEVQIGNSTAMNAMLVLDKFQVTQSVLKEAQARLATTFANRVNDSGDDFSKMQIADIVIDAINYLGEMLPEEFYDVQPANDTEAPADKAADPALELARMGRDSTIQ